MRTSLVALNLLAFLRDARRGAALAMLCALAAVPALGQAPRNTENPMEKDWRTSVDLILPTQDRIKMADTVRGILSYARWPDESQALRLCVVGRSALGEMLLERGLNPLTQRAVTTLRLSAAADVLAQCDALYVGAIEEGPWRQLLSHIAGKPVLTMCERSPVCAIGGMFSLDVDNSAANTPFEVNLDAVARSGVRVNPQVLRLGRRGARSTS